MAGTGLGLLRGYGHEGDNGGRPQRRAVPAACTQFDRPWQRSRCRQQLGEYLRQRGHTALRNRQIGRSAAIPPPEVLRNPLLGTLAIPAGAPIELQAARLPTQRAW